MNRKVIKQLRRISRFTSYRRTTFEKDIMGNLTSRENGGNSSQGSNSHDDSGDVRERPSKRLKVSRTSVAISKGK